MGVRKGYGVSWVGRECGSEERVWGKLGRERVWE